MTHDEGAEKGEAVKIKTAVSTRTVTSFELNQPQLIALLREAGVSLPENATATLRTERFERWADSVGLWDSTDSVMGIAFHAWSEGINEGTERACGGVRGWLHSLEPHEEAQGWVDDLRERFDREFPAAVAHGDPLAMEVCSYAATALLTNQPGWMTGLAKRISRYLESVGDESRVEFDGERMWVKS